MSRSLKERWLRHSLILVVLASAPVLRELFFGIISNHHRPFANLEAIIHTGLEVIFMAFMASVLFGVDFFVSRHQKAELRLTQSVSIEALASLAEYRDTETALHLQQIRSLVEILTRVMYSTPPFSDYLRAKKDYMQDIINASMLHDIGKIAIPDSILLKPGPLTDEEFAIVKRHTVMGGETLAAANDYFYRRLGKESYLRLAEIIARSHHERWDGAGYPDGLAGEDIPLAARIVAICDVYDAVTSERVYKKAWSHEKAIAMIRDNRGIHFDPDITDIFLQMQEEIRDVKFPVGKSTY